MSWEPTLTAKLIAIDRALDGAGIGHAFGGAIALAYCSEPRATKDIDINIAVDPSESGRVLDALVGVERTGAEERVAERDGQLRVWWDGTAIDLFFGFHDFHHQLAGNARRVPFADTEIPVIDGADLVVCKAMFNRSKDWLDIDAIATDGRADLNRARRWLGELIGADAPQLARLDAVIAAHPGRTGTELDPPPRNAPDLGMGL